MGFAFQKAHVNPMQIAIDWVHVPFSCPNWIWLIVLYVLRPKHSLYIFIYFAIKGDGHPPIDRDYIYILLYNM